MLFTCPQLNRWFYYACSAAINLKSSEELFFRPDLIRQTISA